MVRPVPLLLQPSLQVCPPKGEEDRGLGVSQRGTEGGWGDPEASTGDRGRGKLGVGRAASPHHGEVFS